MRRFVGMTNNQRPANHPPATLEFLLPGRGGTLFHDRDGGFCAGTKRAACSFPKYIVAGLRGSVKGQPMDLPTIRNPILPGFNAGPSICRAGDDYYIAVSTFEWYPGVPTGRHRLFPRVTMARSREFWVHMNCTPIRMSRHRTFTRTQRCNEAATAISSKRPTAPFTWCISLGIVTVATRTPKNRCLQPIG